MRFSFLMYLFLSVFRALCQNPPEVKLEKNLVPNGSFENFRKKSNNLRQAIPWIPIASIDFYHKPLDNDTTEEKGAYEGYCYTGFRFQKRYKEFIEVKLVEPLHRGSTYKFTMQVRLAFWSNAVLKSFGVLFSKAGYHRQADAIKSNMIDTIVKRGGLMKGFRWFTVKGYYKADGGEKFITIGNFAREVKKEMIRMNLFKMGYKEAYYFVDDIRLTRFIDAGEKAIEEIVGPNKKDNQEDSSLVVSKDIQVGEKIALPNILFDHGQTYLLAESFPELNKLAQYLMKNPNIQIRINGHTDRSGLNLKNQKTSELRAREVFEYLIKKGVQNKMYFKGFGSSVPIASNDDDEGKAKNRRVEFEIIKK